MSTLGGDPGSDTGRGPAADTAASTAVELAPGVSFTRLPFGGAVLVNGATLMLAECEDRHTAAVERLLVHGVPAGDAEARDLAQAMIGAGWLTTPTR